MLVYFECGESSLEIEFGKSLGFVTLPIWPACVVRQGNDPSTNLLENYGLHWMPLCTLVLVAQVHGLVFNYRFVVYLRTAWEMDFVPMSLQNSWTLDCQIDEADQVPCVPNKFCFVLFRTWDLMPCCLESRLEWTVQSPRHF
jgi:hypothetical protein